MFAGAVRRHGAASALLADARTDARTDARSAGQTAVPFLKASIGCLPSALRNSATRPSRNLDGASRQGGNVTR